MAIPAGGVRELTVEQLRNIITCPISHELFEDPVTEKAGVCNGHTFERVYIEYWLNRDHPCPLTRAHLVATDLISNDLVAQACGLLKEEREGPIDQFDMEAIYRGAEALHERIPLEGAPQRVAPEIREGILARMAQDVAKREEAIVRYFKRKNNYSLQLKDGLTLSFIGVMSVAVGSYFGMDFKPISKTEFKNFAFSTLSICLSGFVGREISMNKVETGQRNKNPLVRYTSLSLGVAGAALIQNISRFRFIWEGASIKQVAFRVALTAGSMGIFDHFLLFPYYKNKVTQNKINRSITEVRTEDGLSKLEDQVIIAKRYGSESDLENIKEKIKRRLIEIHEHDIICK